MTDTSTPLGATGLSTATVDSAFAAPATGAEAIARVRRALTAYQPGTALGEATSRALLAPLGLPFVPSRTADSADEAAAIAAVLAGPVVLKALSDEVIHKSDAGLVELGLVTAAQVRDAYGRLAARTRALGLTRPAIVVQPMADDGTDMFLGWVRDETFGPVVLVGMGGVTVELFRDVAHAVAPLSANDAARLLGSLACAPLLAGYRGRQAVDTTQFCRLVAAVGDLALALPEIADLDLNPVRILPDGTCLALDASAVLAARPAAGAARHPRAPLDLRPLTRPRSVAVIGASRDTAKPGGRVLRSLRRHGFPGAIHPVNPAGGEVGGLPAVTSLSALPVVPDLACIALPAAASVEAVRECVRLGVPAAIVYASGFGESGPEGSALDRELRDAVTGSGMLLCGPNTIGVVSSHHQMAATFSQAVDTFGLRPSGTCVIAQSGAVAGSLVSHELAHGYGIGDWVTVGNQSQLDVADYVSYYAGLDSTTCIALFLEGVADGPRFQQALETARTTQVPVVVYKTGVTAAGRRAVASHSGALAGSETAYRAVLERAGALQVPEMTALLEVAWVLGHTPRPSGRRVAVVTTSGGAGSATADLISMQDLKIATFGEATRAAFAGVLPSFANVDNPLDVTAEGAFTPGTLRTVLEAVSGDPGVDVVCVVLTSITGDDAVRVAQEIADAAGPGRPPLLVSWLVSRALAEDGMRLLAHQGIRVFTEPARMAAAAALLAKEASA
ncbi:acetate--CoA ligase family protein [Streptomyces brasiliensis]|uniref:CoA-binding protein n=1 Tax=Streptomyces brasiliensis TaxID=1954 RepID=A0A917L2V4_9ACTN|nr:acetate--CoA ligase family protein [Streptomyces brasiliensis]GGJ39876.1 CoA-binding protein [Streptomyces brasiliensis]